MQPQISQPQWLQLSTEVRLKIRQAFGIKQSGATQAILGTFGKTVSDGCTDNDLSVITVESMQNFLGNHHLTDYYALFSEVLSRLNSESPPPLEEIPATLPYERWKEQLLAMREESEAIDLVLNLKHIVWEIFPQPHAIQPTKPTSNEKPANKGAKKGK